jgi:hypothetical protein
MNAKGETTAHKKDELEKFKSGPVRGLTAVGKSVRGVDIREIDVSLGKINTAVQALPKAPTDTEIKGFHRQDAGHCRGDPGRRRETGLAAPPHVKSSSRPAPALAANAAWARPTH